MKKIYVTISMAMAVALAASAGSKFDGNSIIAINYFKDAKANPAALVATPVELPFDLKMTARGAEAETGVIITLQPGVSFDVVEAAGLTIETTFGDDMCVATGSIEDIIALEDNDQVKSMSLGSLATPCLDVARTQTGAAEIHAGTDLPQAYKGTGVICGIYDTGVDPNHINFYDAAFTASRVKSVYYFNGQSGGNIAYTTPEAISGFKTDNTAGTHGTHTLGCMTGAYCLSGSGASGRPKGSTAILKEGASVPQVLASLKNPYYGPAPAADIVVGCGALYNTNISAAVGKIVDYAKATGQPAVINLSIGSVNGPHDGTDAMSQALERAGKDAIICISAGNEGEANISVVKTLTASDKQVKTMLNFPSNSTGILDIYGSDKNTFGFTVAIIDKTTGEIKMQKAFNTEGSSVLATSNYTAAGYLHDAAFDAAFASSNLQIAVSDNTATSGRHGVSIQYTLSASSATNNARNLVLALIVDGSAGQRIDITNRVVSGSTELSSNGFAGWSDGTPELSISSMACGKNVIVVGAWTSRVKWGTVGRGVYSYNEGAHLTLDEVSAFSSYGTLYDGRKLPDICAPGAAIISSYNSYFTGRDTNRDVARYEYNDRTYAWQVEQGTSMASPICAGVIATWLEADPTLTVDRVRDIIKSTAGELNGGNPGQANGGKLDGYAGLKEVLRQNAVNDVKIDNDILVTGCGANLYEVYVPGGDVNVAVYNLSGQPVFNASTKGDTLQVDLSGVATGIYLVNVNGVRTERVVVK